MFKKFKFLRILAKLPFFEDFGQIARKLDLQHLSQDDEFAHSWPICSAETWCQKCSSRRSARKMCVFNGGSWHLGISRKTWCYKTLVRMTNSFTPGQYVHLANMFTLSITHVHMIIPNVVPNGADRGLGGSCSICVSKFPYLFRTSFWNLSY